MNALTSLAFRAAKIPIYFDTDREVLTHALATLPVREPGQVRLVRIANTLSVGTMQVSPACLPTVDGHPLPNLEITGEAHELAFDADANLTPLSLRQV